MITADIFLFYTCGFYLRVVGFEVGLAGGGGEGVFEVFYCVASVVVGYK